MEFGQSLTEKIDAIVEDWMAAVYQDQQIESAQELPYKALRDSCPRVLHALATVLSESEANDLQSLVEASLEHGVVRAEQGYDPSEVAREYHLLRAVIFSSLEAELLQAPPQEMLRAVRLINAVIDEAIARCFDSYTNGRLQELYQLQNQLKLTNQELTRLVRANQDNLSHLAHELKTPLTSIIGYSDLFLRQQRQTDDVKDSFTHLEHIERVLRGGRQVLRLINDALEISRYEAGKMKLQSTSIEVQDLIGPIVEMVEPLVQAKTLELVVDCDRAPQQVVTDALRLQQIITNLLSNAIRYTEAGSITLKCETLSDQQWAIAITDTGMGIDPEDQARIFEPYFRVDSSPQANSLNSTGLGLAIVSRLVSLLQGKIILNSQVGVGSIFTVVLPLTLDSP